MSGYADGSLFVLLDGEYIRIAPCQVFTGDGGVFAFEESEATRKTVTWRRIGTLRDGHFTKLKEAEKRTLEARAAAMKETS